MKKKLTLWILLFPIVLFAQTGVNKDGVITIDFGKKKKKQEDTTQIQEQVIDEEEEEMPDAKKEKRQAERNREAEEAADFRKTGLFKGLFTVGINGSQVDGDSYAGYNKPGLEANVGAMIRFHKNLSASLEMGYSMKGARQAFIFNAAPQTLMKYRSIMDYVQVPLALNIHDNKLIIFSIGVAPSVLIRYSERDEMGEDITDTFFLGTPKRFDLPAFASLHFVFKEKFTFGLKFSYSTFGIRPSFNRFRPTRLGGQHHNVIALRFMYILNAKKK